MGRRRYNISPEDTSKILQMRSEGVSYRIIGENFGMTIIAVRRFCDKHGVTAPRHLMNRPRQPTRRSHWAIRLIFRTLDERSMKITDLSKVSGLNHQSIHKWAEIEVIRPNIYSVEDCLNALGYRLTVVDQKGREVSA